jgi:hypothetical protein
MWVDRNFSHSVLSGMYNFHASASAYTQFWNDCAAVTSSSVQVTRRLVWQTFVQESIRTIASVKNINLELREDLNLNQVTREAFLKLGNAGIIEPGKEHSCSQCSQPYKSTADFMINDDPAAVIGADENSAVPVLTGEYANISAHETAAECQVARIRANNLNNRDENDLDMNDNDVDDVRMIILDGVVMAPMVNYFNYFFLIKLIFCFIFKHCAYEKCTNDLKNARGGAFCKEHEISYGNKCQICDCPEDRVENSLACQAHQAEW